MPDNDTQVDGSTTASITPSALEDGTPAKPRARLARPILLLLGPLFAATAGGYAWLNSGRYIGTDNAYVKADIVTVSAEVSGPVSEVAVQENQRVAAGDVLFTVDERPYRVALARAEAQVEAVKSFIESLKHSYQQKLEELELARTNIAFADHEYRRLKTLSENKLASEADVDSARHALDVAERQIPILNQALAQLEAQLGGAPNTPLTSLAAYLTVKAQLDAATLDLERTTVRAPIAGVASKVPVTGRHAAPGAPLMSLVSDHDVWIEANYKETELTHVCTGQAAAIRVDTYPDHTWRGRVESISPATGAEFSVIPPQNATGNWVKVTQRIPVRIAVETAPGDPELRAGMSVNAEIDSGYRRPRPRWIPFDGAENAMPAAPFHCPPPESGAGYHHP